MPDIPEALTVPHAEPFIRPKEVARPMEVQEALRQAEAHLKNAQELAGRPVGKEELLYMWDNQITALDNFLADTESVPDPKFKELRGQLRDVKKRLTDAVVAFEAQAAGESAPEGEPTPEEWVESYIEQADEMLQLVREALSEKVVDVKDLVKWEEPLAVVNGYLADSEPYQDKSHDLRKARSRVRLARKDLKGSIDQVFLQWKQADRASAAGDDEEEEAEA